MEELSHSANEVLAAPANQRSEMTGAGDSVAISQIKDANIPSGKPDFVGWRSCEPWLPQPRFRHNLILPPAIRKNHGSKKLLGWVSAEIALRVFGEKFGNRDPQRFRQLQKLGIGHPLHPSFDSGNDASGHIPTNQLARNSKLCLRHVFAVPNSHDLRANNVARGFHLKPRTICTFCIEIVWISRQLVWKSRQKAMLRVHAIALPSPIHGHGLFAQEPISAGDVIWAFDPPFDLRFSEEDLRKLAPAAQRQVLYYSSFEQHSGCYLLTGDDDRFINHSDSPNAVDGGDSITALRDIQPGEEITLDYSQLGYSFRCK